MTCKNHPAWKHGGEMRRLPVASQNSISTLQLKESMNCKQKLHDDVGRRCTMHIQGGPERSTPRLSSRALKRHVPNL